MFLKTQVLNGFRSSTWLSPARSACSGAATLILHARSQISSNCGNFSSDFVGRVYEKMWNQSMTFYGYVGVYKYIDMWNKPWFPVRNMIYIHGGSSTSLRLRIGDPRSPVLVVWLRFFHLPLPRIISVSSSKQIWIRKKLRKYGLRKWCPTHKQSGLDSDFWASNP